jgi:hypothetical protein
MNNKKNIQKGGGVHLSNFYLNLQKQNCLSLKS